LAQQLEDLPLPTRQFGISVADDQTAAPWTRIAKLGDDPAHERTWDCGVAAQRVGKGMRQPLTGNVFQEVAAGARAKSREEVVGIARDGQHDDLRGRQTGCDLASRLRAAS